VAAKCSGAVTDARWRVDFMGTTLRHVGRVDAATAEQAIDEVAKLFRIEPAVRDKLMATKVEARDKAEKT
jgi:hypothetical protein